MRYSLFAFVLFICAGSLKAQIQIDKAVELTGSGSNAKVSGLQDVSSNNDAANKIYVDTAIANRAGSSTLNPALAVVLTTSNVSNIRAASGIVGGNVLSVGTSAVSSRGVCYSTSPNPTISSSVAIASGTTGAFSMTLSGLTHSTTYYVRAFATNGSGTAYGAEISFVTPGLQIGETYAGGVVFYLNGSGGGIVAAAADAPSTYPWGCYSGGGGSAANGTAIGTGLSNTNAGCLSSGTAADYCYNLVQGGYSDWYLPSRDELQLMYTHRIAIGGFTLTTTYWSSTIGSNSSFFALPVNFSTGNSGDDYKNSGYKVRPVRNF